MSKYERLTNQKWSKDIDLTQELGYSHIYKRLHELEDKIENGTLAEEIIKAGYNKNSQQKTLNDLLDWLDGNTVRNPKQAVEQYMREKGYKINKEN